LVMPSVVAYFRCHSSPECERDMLGDFHAISVALLALFVVYLCYRLGSHRTLFEPDTHEPSDDIPERLSTPMLAIQVLVMVATLGLATLCAIFLVRDINGVIESQGISGRFVSFVLIPLAADGPARAEAILAAYSGQMTKSLDFAIGRSMQVALLITPALVLLSWASQTKAAMTLHFPILETTGIFLGVILVAELCRDGRGNYLKGAMCLVT